MHSLLEGGLAGAVSSRLARWVHSRSEGNPLFACELVLGGLTGGGIDEERGVWRLRREPPPSPRLAELLQARMARIGDQERRGLALIALGEALDIDILAGLVGQDVLGRLESSGLARVQHDGSRFAVAAGHPLFADLARQDLGDAIGRELRAALADVMQARGELAPADLVRVAVLRLDARLNTDPRLLAAAAAHAYRAFDLELAVRLAPAARDEGAARRAGRPAPTADGRHACASPPPPPNGPDPGPGTRRMPGAFRTSELGFTDYRSASTSEPGYRHRPETTPFTTGRYEA